MRISDLPEKKINEEWYDPNNYNEQRVVNRINWYDRTAVKNKTNYQRTQLGILVSGILIPIINIISFAPDEVRLISSILGGIIIGLTGFLQLRKYHENWLLYRSTAESLRREYYFYNNKVGTYSDIKNDEARKKEFVERIEAIIAAENNRFIMTHRQKPGSSS